MNDLKSSPAYPEGEGPCDDCRGSTNVIWFTDDLLWNWVIRRFLTSEQADPFLCIPCFVARVHKIGLEPTGWRVVPEFHWETTQDRTWRLSPKGDVLKPATDTTTSSGPASVIWTGSPS